MAGIGDRAIGIMALLGLGGMADNKEEEQGATHTMPDGTVMPGATHQGGGDTGSGMGMGIGNMMTNLSNSMFEGMSQEDVYRMGQGFNTLRFEPDAQMAANFESRLGKISENRLVTAKNNDTIAYLRTLKSPEYPNGRQDLIELVEDGLLPATDALNEARTVKPSTALEQKLEMYRNPNLTDNERAFLFPAASKSDFLTKWDILHDPSNIDADGNLLLSDGEIQLMGISEPAVYKQKISDLDAKLERKEITQEEYKELSLNVIAGMTPDDGKTDKYKMLEMVAGDRGFTKGSEDWNKFFDVNMAGDSVNVEIGDTVVDMDSEASASNLYLKEYMPQYIKDSTKIMQDVDTARTQVKKLGDLLDILEADESGQGVSPYTGFFQPLLTEMSRIVTSNGLDKKYESEIEAYKNSTGEAKTKARDILYEKLVRTEITKVMTGSDVFPMISSLGIGARGLDTPAERDFLISVMTGLPNMTLDTLKYMTKFRLQMYIDGMEKYNEKFDSGYFDLHNNNPNLPKRGRIDIEPLRRYTQSGSKIARNDSGQAIKSYSQAERDLIMKGLGSAK